MKRERREIAVPAVLVAASAMFVVVFAILTSTTSLSENARSVIAFLIMATAVWVPEHRYQFMSRITKRPHGEPVVELVVIGAALLGGMTLFLLGDVSGGVIPQ